MQNNAMLQARYRYLQARRDLEYMKLKEQELAKASEVIAKPIEPDNLAECSECKRVFIDRRGLTSHWRLTGCGAPKD